MFEVFKYTVNNLRLRIPGPILSVFLTLGALVVSLALPIEAHATEAVPGEFIVKLKGKANSPAHGNFMRKLKASKAAQLRTSFSKMNLHHFKTTPGVAAESLLNDLRNDPDVEYVEPNYIVRKTSEIPAQMLVASKEDILTSVSGGADSLSAGSYSQSGASVGVESAWASRSPASSKIPVVAVIDTGVDYTHTVFTQSGAIWINQNEIPGNGVDDDANGFIDDYRGWNFHATETNGGVPQDPKDDDNHGTHVAGIILGANQDIFATPLEQAKVQIMPLKFLGGDGSGKTSDAIKAIYYAVNNGADIINNSWGGGAFSQSLLDAITYAYDHSVLVVNAAGNSGTNNDQSPMYPASYDVPGAIAVAASNDSDILASWSNYGKASVHLSAPGVSISSTVKNNMYAYSSGTSMAAPFVSGVAAMVVRESPNLTGFQIREILAEKIDAVSTLSEKVITGGRINALQAVEQAKLLAGADPYQPQYTPSQKTSVGETRSLASEGGVKSGGGCGTVSGISGSGGGGTSLSPIMQKNLFEKSPPPVWSLLLLALPFMVWFALRNKGSDNAKSRRKFDRFSMNSEIKIKVGDRELVGNMNTISVGGASFNTEALIEKGGLITMMIQSPDGKEEISVQGRVVWNEENKSFGVQFAETKDMAKEAIERWSQKLEKC